jgi:hypothetical protein
MAGGDKSHIEDPAVKDANNISDNRLNIKSIAWHKSIFIADLVVLAIDAPQVAVPEEKVADSPVTGYGRLFAAVNADGADHVRCICVTVAQLPRISVGTAFSRTDAAVFQFGVYFVIHHFEQLESQNSKSQHPNSK